MGNSSQKGRHASGEDSGPQINPRIFPDSQYDFGPYSQGQPYSQRGGAQTRFQHLGLMLSWTARVNLQDSIQAVSEKLITDNLKQNPLIKITGDNLDIYVKTSHLSQERRNKDLHMFTSNIIFSRVATVDMSTSIPNTDISKLNYASFTMTEIEKAKFLEAYSVLLARILCKIPAFEKFQKLVPNHLPHEFSQKMSRKSIVHPLQILMKNECKHEDCLAIMDTYEQELIRLYTQAFGNTDILRKYGVPVGGDQLTRVRLQEAKTLRTLSVTPEKRYDDLNPIVCEMWHSKQDFLERARAATSVSQTDTTQVKEDKLLPTVIKWEGGGKDVYVSGTFNSWKCKLPLAKSHGDFLTIVDLPEGEHQYKFYVDGNWVHNPNEPSAPNNLGTLNNIVSVKRSDFEVFEALALDSSSVIANKNKHSTDISGSPPGEYAQEFPVRKPGEKQTGPPILPPHLLQVILNRDTPAHCEPTLLPEPNHVMLNHLYALSIKDGVMVLSATHRFRKKYVTTLLYKPI